MTTVNGSSSRGQVSASRDFHDQDFEKDQKILRLMNSSSDQKENSPEEVLTFVEGKTPLKILYILDKYYPKKLQSVEISKLSGIHRTTISVRCKELYELGVIQRDYLSGTEKKINPTYLFSVSKDLKRKLKNFLQLKLQLDSSLADLDPIKDSESIGLSPSTQAESYPEDFESQAKLLFAELIEEVRDLRNRVSDLEMNLFDLKKKEDLEDEKASKKVNTVDLSEMLGSFGANSGGSK